MTATKPSAVKTRLLLRMERGTDLLVPREPDEVKIRRYSASRDHLAIRQLYGAAFNDEPWPDDWHEFAEFDPNGVFVARAPSGMAGYVISFQRNDFGYISVVAVRPEHQRCGVAGALLGAAVGYLRGLGLETVRIDAYGDSPAAVATYWSLGFRIYDIALEAA